ncbi:nitrogen regulation protein NR(II) [Planctomycetota bacterium]
MADDVDITVGAFDGPIPYGHAVLHTQLHWLIDLRWLAIVGIAIAVSLGKYVFTALDNVLPIYGCATLLLACNLVYFQLISRSRPFSTTKAITLGMVQVVLDLAILTAVLYFSGGLSNPFTLFYIFHVIIAAIILPRWCSLSVAITAVALYIMLAVNEMGGGLWPGYHPLRLAVTDTLWRDPLYVHGASLAFAFTVFLARYLTRIVIVRMSVKEAEAARNHEVLKAVIRAMNEGLIFVNQDHKVVFANPAATALVTDNSASDHPPLTSFPSPLQQYICNTNWRDVREQAVAPVMEFETDELESRTFEAKGSSVPGLDGKSLGYVIVARDLTERKSLERTLMEQAEQVTAINEMLKMSRVKMAQREKMVAIGQMAAGIAHEIGNPLASLSSVVQYLGRKTESSEQKEQLVVIQMHVKRISDILKRMLTFSRPATAEYRWSDLDELVANTLSLVTFDQRMRETRVENITDGALPTVWLNPQSFEQVLLNIFLNAMDAMNAQADTVDKVLEITRGFDGQFVEIRIRDTGVGMAQEVADRAFESFFTTKEIGKGTGLGLFISHNLVTELDGSIRIESEPGVGTTVIVSIPVQPKANLFSDETNNTSAQRSAFSPSESADPE